MSTLQNRITQLSPAKLALLSQRLKEKENSAPHMREYLAQRLPIT